MEPTIEFRFEQLEEQKRSFLQKVAQFPADQLYVRPAEKVWSVLDVMDHLIKVEERLIEEIRKGLPRGAPVRLGDRARFLMLQTAMMAPVRVKVPEGAPMVLPDRTMGTLRNAERRWGDARANLAEVLDELGAAELRVGVVKHPVSGWLNVVMALDFLMSHLKHHGYQLGRLRGMLPR